MMESIERATGTVWDAAVIGAGPAGTVAAMGLRGRGLRVLLVERAGFPRDKVCGDGLIADSLRVLQRLGLLEEIQRLGRPSRRLRVYSPRRIEVRLEGDFLALKRSTLDARLAREAVARGARLCVAEATGATTGADGLAHVTLKGEARPVRARAAVVATGARLTVAGPALRTRPPRPTGVAVRCYVRSSRPIDDWLVSFDRSIVPGYGWIFPVGDDEYNVGCGVFYDQCGGTRPNLRELFETFVRRFPPALELLAGRIDVSPLTGAPLRCGLNGPRFYDGGRVVTAGEAVGTTLHLTGEGIGKAMETGELAATAVADALATEDFSRLEALEAQVREAMGPIHRGFAAAQRWMSRGWVADLSALRLATSTGLRSRLEGVLSETIAPEEILSLKGLAAFGR